MKEPRAIRGAVVAGVVLGLSLVPAAARGVTLIPTRFDDPAPGSCEPADCSLREAVIAANAAPGPDTIALAAGVYTLSHSLMGSENAAAEGDLDLTEGTTTILGASVGSVIDGGGTATSERVFDIRDTAVAEMARVTVRGGNAVGTSGGGFYVGGTLTLAESTVTANTASNYGGAIEDSSGTLNLTNVTVTGNSVGQDGGGIDNAGSGMDPFSATLNNVTITGNTADSDANNTGNGGGLWIGTGTLTMRSSILAGNVDASPGFKSPNCIGEVTSQGHILVGSDQGCTVTSGPGDKVGTAAAPIDPQLAPLADNGGPTPTQALLPGSPAIDAGDPAAPGSGGTACEGADQRGAPRLGSCDMGAYELVRCLGTVVNRVGTDGADDLAGTSEPDAFLGLGGSDAIRALGANDRVCAGPGKDTAAGGSGNDRLLGEQGKDLLRGGAGKDRLVGGPGRDTCTGGPKRDKARSCETEKAIP